MNYTKDKVINMEVKVKNEEEEFLIDPEDRDIIRTAEEKLHRLAQHDKELIESIFEHNIAFCDANHPNPLIPSSIGRSLETILNSQAATFLLTVMVNPQHIRITLDGLIKEKLISENTSQFILELTVKYGDALHTIILNTERPHDWIRLSSDVLISNGIIKLQSQIFRADGEVFKFTSKPEEIITFVEHFMRRTLETIKTMDKEMILELDETRIDSIQKQIDDLKDFHKSVKQEVEEFEQNKETHTIDSSE